MLFYPLIISMLLLRCRLSVYFSGKYQEFGGLFRVNRPRVEAADEVVEEELTQIGRALRELDIGWIPAHSPQAKGRIERFFGTAQDRLVKG